MLPLIDCISPTLAFGHDRVTFSGQSSMSRSDSVLVPNPSLQRPYIFCLFFYASVIALRRVFFRLLLSLYLQAQNLSQLDPQLESEASQ